MHLISKPTTKLGRKIVAAAAVLLVGTSSVFAAPAEKPNRPDKVVRRGQEAAYEITKTDHGKRSAQETAAKWAKEYNVDIAPADLRVYNFGSEQNPDLLIIPSEVEFEAASIETQPDGTIQVAVDYTVDAEKLVGKAKGQASVGVPAAQRARKVPGLAALMQQSAAWQFWTNGCLATTNDTYGVMNSCWDLYKGTPESDGSRDFWQLVYWGTAKSKGIYGLSVASVEAAASSTGSAQTLGGFEPREDTYRNGVAVDIGVEAYNFGLSVNRTQYETWDIDQPLSTSMPRFKNNWRTGAVAKYGLDRTVALGLATSVPQGGYPRYYQRHAFAVSV